MRGTDIEGVGVADDLDGVQRVGLQHVGHGTQGLQDRRTQIGFGWWEQDAGIEIDMDGLGQVPHLSRPLLNAEQVWLASSHGLPNDRWLARMLASQRFGHSALPDGLGLAPPDFEVLLQRHFPGLGQAPGAALPAAGNKKASSR